MAKDDFTPTFDAAAAYPELAALRQALRTHDWAAVRALYDPAGWDGRELLLLDVATQPGTETLLRSVLERDPDDLVATTMHAARTVVLGWDVRTSARAKDVSREQFRVFFEHLRRAEETLIWACAHDPGIVTAWTQRVLTARGLQLGLSEGRRRYDRVIALAPHHLAAQTLMLQTLCPKWSGDLTTLHAFVDACVQAAPPGAHNGMLVVDAHFEHAAEIGNLKHFDGYEVKQEIRAAGERSVLHPDFRRTPGWVRTLSWFALGYSLIGDWGAAKRCFTELGPFASENVWSSLGDPKQSLLKYRSQAMERG
jgi:hypothetical protein